MTAGRMAYYPVSTLYIDCPQRIFSPPSLTNTFPNMTTILQINNHLAAMEAVISTFQSLMTRITVLLRLEGANFGGLQNLVAISILEGAEDNRDTLALIREDAVAVAMEMDMAGLQKLERLVDRVAEEETGFVEGEAALRDRMKSYENRRSDSHVVSF